MDVPESQVPYIIRSLTQSTREDQRRVLEKYFLPNAYFIHPFCRVPSFGDKKIPFTNQSVNSLWFVFFIYQWYRILSPKIELDINSVAFDKKQNLLYVTLHQTFTLWIVPFSLWQANVKLVTVLNLEHLPVGPDGKPVLDAAPSATDANSDLYPKRYFIKGQEDNYQVEDFLKFIAPWGASMLWTIWQLFATLVCVVGVTLLRVPLAWFRENVLGLDSRAIKTKQ
ncbi:hypothetical protein Hte_004882 [Hypoxylon texense]